MTDFSVVITSYNGKEFLRRCLIAVSKSAFKPRQVIIVDDFPDDNTKRMVQYHAFSSLPVRCTQTGRSAPTLALSSASKVSLVNFNLALEFAGLKFRDVIERFTQALVHARDCLVIYAQISRDIIFYFPRPLVYIFKHPFVLVDRRESLCI